MRSLDESLEPLLAPASTAAAAAVGAEADAASPSTSWTGRALAWDRRLSARLFLWYKEHWPGARGTLLFLEFSGHGVPWIIWPLLLLACDRRMTVPGLSVLFHFYAGTLLDLAAIGVIKPLVRRARPHYNPGLQIATVNAVDQFSFPSGHASRSFYVATFVLYGATVRPRGTPEWLQHPLVLGLLVAWALAVAVSRVALGRHHVLDVVFGSLLGMSYVLVLHLVWFPDDAIAAKRETWITSALFRVNSYTGNRNCAIDPLTL
jgi:presqualene diphosphate phosphatase